MGYSTDFDGEFEVTPRLTPEHQRYLEKFAETRRMKRSADAVAKMPDPVREEAGLPVGPEGAYFVGGERMYGQAPEPSILDYNCPPEGQPGLWCQWQPNGDGTAIEWDGGEKFYEYDSWIAYLIEHFLAPWGYDVNGTVYWYGENPEDRGRIVVKGNKVYIQQPEYPDVVD